MAIPAYMEIKEIKGTVIDEALPERNEMTKVLKFEHKLHIPIKEDKKPSGVRQHGDFLIVKNMDKSSPLIIQALCQNKALNVTLNWYYLDDTTGIETLYYQHILENAKVISVRNFMSNDENSPLNHMEEVVFAYKKITWQDST